MSADRPQPTAKLPTGWRSSLYIAPAVAVAAAALLAWALFWPTGECSNPACARKRFALAIEVDTFAQVPPIAFEVSTPEGKASLSSVMRGGGIDAQVLLDQLDIPFQESSGALDRADLYQLVSHWRDRSSVLPKVDARLYALMTTALVSDSGEPLFGVMFDVAGREGFAVAPRTTARFFQETEPELVETLQLRTFLHELLHALNRDHIDAAQMDDGRLTLEAPTRCISREKVRRQWDLREPPLMALSPETIRFFQTAASRDVLPGRGNTPFRHRRVSATECEDARANAARVRAASRWQFAFQRIRELFLFRDAAAAETRGDDDGTSDSGASAVELSLQALPAAYPLGYPIGVRIVAWNVSSEALPLEGRLSPGYGMVRIEYRRADAAEWRVLQPLTWFEPVNDADAMLAPQARTEQTVPIYFSEDGWTFDSPGEYQVRAVLQVAEYSIDATSEPITVRVDEPRTEHDREALRPLLDAQGQLDPHVGRLLSFGGRIGTAADIAPLEAGAALYGHTALGGALRLTLLSQRLRRPIDPMTGARPAPDFGDARELLEDTCTDSGVAALTYELLQQQMESLPAEFHNRVETAAAAWDGTTATSGTPLATYSDPELSLWESTLHFCFNESRLRGPVRAAIPDMARRLKRERPARIVIVGHGDHMGNCRLNDTLALRRAHTVRSALLAAGINRHSIEVASLGERRPLDFSASETAHELNRRVEILIEGATRTAETQRRIVPRCPTR